MIVDRSMECPLTVAFYMHDFAGGGVERMRLVLFKALSNRHVLVAAIVSKFGGPLVNEIPASTRIVKLHAARTLAGILPLAALLRRRDFDVVVSNLDHNNIALLLARVLAGPGTRIVIAQHNALSAEARLGWRYRIVPLLYRVLWPYADAVLAVSEGVASDLSRAACIDRKAISVIYNPVVDGDFSNRAQATPPHPWLCDATIPVFVFVGRLTYQKDPATLLEAMAKRLLAGPARLIFVGSGDLEASLAARAKFLGISDQVCFAGFQADPLPWIQHATALVSSSRYEGFGNVLVEALACGTQVIATDCPFGPAEILGGGAFGTLVAVGDAEGMATAMMALPSPNPRAAERRARAAVFSVAACTDQHLALFARLMPAPWRRQARRIFGLAVTSLDAVQCAAHILSPRTDERVRLLTTPNIDHLRLLRQPAFAEAYASASLVCIDGFPLALYARLRGLRPSRRVTGCEVFHHVMNGADLARHRFFFVVECGATAAALADWLRRRGLEHASCVEVAVSHLSDDEAAQVALAQTVRRYGATILVMALGAPVSELFVHSQRARLPGCWALCVGQAVRVEVGLTRRAPSLMRRLGFEWAWRLAHEPRRLGGRYVLGAAWFPVAIVRDLLSARAAAIRR